MCEFRMWRQLGEDRYILQCTYCATYHIRLGNISLIFEPAAYKLFRKTVSDMFISENTEEQGPFIVPSFTEGADLMLARQQLHDLQRLLEEADTEMQTMHLLGLF